MTVPSAGVPVPGVAGWGGPADSSVSSASVGRRAVSARRGADLSPLTPATNARR